MTALVINLNHKKNKTIVNKPKLIANLNILSIIFPKYKKLYE